MSGPQLKELARRVAVLTKELPQYRAILDVIAGAIFAAFRATELEYKHRDLELSDKYLQNLTMRLERMADGRLPKKHGWLAGFYFNSAIQRIAAAGEQLAGILKRLERQAKRQGKETEASNNLPALDEIREEVNRFKHDETGLERGRRITPSSAVKALSEIVQTLEKYQKPLSVAKPESKKR